MKPLAIISSHPIQYQTPLFAYLNGNGVPNEVFFLTRNGLDTYRDPGFGAELSWDIPLLDGIEPRFPFSVGRHDDALRAVHPSLLRQISPKRYSGVLVHGYREPSVVAVIMAALARGLPVLYRSETTVKIAGRSARHRVMQAVLRRAPVRCLSIGSLNDRFYADVGVPEHRRVIAPYCVDNERIAQGATAADREHVRAQLGLRPDHVVAVFVGKLVGRKGCRVLLESFTSVADSRSALLFVGTGELESELRSAAAESGATVRFAGFANQSELPAYYKASDVLVLPSEHEPWGLVVNEAMAAGLPAIVSSACGCVPDLVEPGVTGDVVPPGDVDRLADVLRAFLHDHDMRRRCAAGARNRIATWDFEAFRLGVVSALAGSRA